MRDNDREKYGAFFGSFGLQLKYGVYSDYGPPQGKAAERSVALQELLRAELLSSRIRLPCMKEGQTKSTMPAGDNETRLPRLPQAERLTEKGYEILFMTDDIDEFAVKAMRDYDGKAFCSVAEAEVETEEEKEEIKKQADDNRAPLRLPQGNPGRPRQGEVRPTGRLKSFPACLTTEGGISLWKWRRCSIPCRPAKRSRPSVCLKSTPLIRSLRSSKPCLRPTGTRPRPTPKFSTTRPC